VLAVTLGPATTGAAAGWAQPPASGSKVIVTRPSPDPTPVWNATPADPKPELARS
jgi:hypothetical protein